MSTPAALMRSPFVRPAGLANLIPSRSEKKAQTSRGRWSIPCCALLDFDLLFAVRFVGGEPSAAFRRRFAIESGTSSFRAARRPRPPEDSNRTPLLIERFRIVPHGPTESHTGNLTRIRQRPQASLGNVQEFGCLPRSKQFSWSMCVCH